MRAKTKYETIVGLEVHVQLSTKSKAYCRDKNKYGESPNSCISPVTLGYPGTLPKINYEVINRAIKLGIALNCKISKYNLYSRKNYFYLIYLKVIKLPKTKHLSALVGTLKFLIKK